ncbi:MAG: hypothetical protein OSA11_09825 [Candidatus Nanopelagicales bacterium]|nr:hypothetical protein [Candidatus Nanopelagicales bacterium]
MGIWIAKRSHVVFDQDTPPESATIKLVSPARVCAAAFTQSTTMPMFPTSVISAENAAPELAAVLTSKA